jgi:hypothetical protein
MIESTATTLTKSLNAVRHLRFGEAAKLLRMKAVPPRVSLHKSVGNNWLEFHFGWAPLIGDIYDAVDVLNNPVKSFSYERSRATDPFEAKSSYDFGSVLQDQTGVGYISVTQGGRLKFEKPGSSFTLQQWGILNPATIAWELIPYSFVVDWFVNVGDFLSSQTDFAGMTLESTFESRKYDILVSERNLVKPGFSPTWTSNSQVRYVFQQRTTSLSGISLEVKKLKPPSLVRGATA